MSGIISLDGLKSPTLSDELSLTGGILLGRLGLPLLIVLQPIEKPTLLSVYNLV